MPLSQQARWPSSRRWLASVCVLAGACALAPAHAQTACGSLDNGDNGPFDYRTERGPRLKVVESYHFNPMVEELVKGQSGQIAGDLDYVLRAFPNHHRALTSMAKYGLRAKSPTAPNAPRSVECYFERAIRFRPDDTTARMLYAWYLGQIKRIDDAAAQVDQCVKLAPDNAFTQYNAGMVYAELKLYDKALQQAHTSARLGFARPELKQILVTAGRWVDDVQAADAAASEPASGSASAPAPKP